MRCHIVEIAYVKYDDSYKFEIIFMNSEYIWRVFQSFFFNQESVICIFMSDKIRSIDFFALVQIQNVGPYFS